MEIEIGKVTHFFNGISVAVIELTDTLKVGDTVHIKGATTDFVQKVESMEINHQKVKEAGYGESIGLKVKERVREGDKVYKVVEEAVKPELEAKERAGKAEKAEKAGAEKAEKRKRGRPKKKK
jgi:putative protease